MSNVAFPAVVMSGPKPSLNSPIKLGFPVIVTQLAGGGRGLELSSSTF